MTTLTKSTVQATWTPTKIQEETARVAASNMLAAFQVISKMGEPAMAEFQAASRQFKVAHLKSLGVKNALELAKAMAEQDANLFGSKIEIAGDETSATLTYNSCGMWEALKKVGKLTPEQEEKFGASFQTCMQSLAGEFGLKTDVKFANDTCAVSFSK